MTVGKYINELFWIVNRVKVLQSIQKVFPNIKAKDELTDEVKQAIDSIVYYELLLLELKSRSD